MKKCSKCKEEKNVSEYYKNTNGSLLSYCKTCRKTQVKKRSKDISNNPNKIIITTKICFNCSVEKPASGFYKNKYRIDGLTDECKKCAKEKAKENKRKYSSGELAHKVVVSKICCKCNTEKTIDEFNKNKAMIDGHGTECKNCMNEYGVQYKEDNRGYFDKYMAQYRINNLSKFAEYQQRRKEQKLSTSIEYFSRDDVMNLYGLKCFYCDGSFEHLDHYIPLSKGGSHTLDNVRPSCKRCNLKKNAKLPEEWYTYLEKVNRR